ncbi:hypothetical protein FHS21_004964 [Phyllobacterium trifolii]|uniref:Uncharacterized protein n=1 Tax=Phyllobacterium trifolii TaxID=300193 RepID=A0A839UBT8_9HYPH|nr:hypothetical protein [Phyllobacterium trifolii]MBB3148516.1 hypothetical protein [Phyllobacterium trifolii]
MRQQYFIRASMIKTGITFPMSAAFVSVGLAFGNLRVALNRRNADDKLQVSRTPRVPLSLIDGDMMPSVYLRLFINLRLQVLPPDDGNLGCRHRQHHADLVL